MSTPMASCPSWIYSSCCNGPDVIVTDEEVRYQRSFALFLTFVPSLSWQIVAVFGT
jgi:hypothetical protein